MVGVFTGVIVLSSCTTLGLFETAQVVEKGHSETIVAVSMVYTDPVSAESEFTEEGFIAPALNYGMRFGVSERMDLGVNFDIYSNLHLRWKIQIKDSSSTSKIAFGPALGTNIGLMLNKDLLVFPSAVLYLSQHQKNFVFFQNIQLSAIALSSEDSPFKVSGYGLGIQVGFISYPIKSIRNVGIGLQGGVAATVDNYEYRLFLGYTQKF